MSDVQGPNAVFSVSRTAAESVVLSQYWAAREFHRAIKRTAVILAQIHHQFAQEQKSPETIAGAGFDNTLTLVANNLHNQYQEFVELVATVLVSPLGNPKNWGNAARTAQLPALGKGGKTNPASDPGPKDELFLTGDQMLELAGVCDNWRQTVLPIHQNICALAAIVCKPHHIPKLAVPKREEVTAGWLQDWEIAGNQFTKNFWLPAAFGLAWPPEAPQRWE